MKTYYVCGNIEVPNEVDVHDILTKMCEVAEAHGVEADFEQVDDITEDDDDEEE